MIKISVNNIPPSNRTKIMWDYCPNCFWCGRKTEYIKVNWKIVTGGQVPDNVATIEHLYSKKDQRRHDCKRLRIPSPTVIACYKCNHKRGGEYAEIYAYKIGKEFDMKYEFIFC